MQDKDIQRVLSQLNKKPTCQFINRPPEIGQNKVNGDNQAGIIQNSQWTQLIFSSKVMIKPVKIFGGDHMQH